MTPDEQFDADVIVVGAGPVGLTIANTLGLHDVRTLLVERGEELIDYPRGVGMDDECLRTIQGIGLAGAVLPHITPNHWMRFVTRGGYCFASIEPRTDEFGWSRRNAFNQPAVDRELLAGLARFPAVSVKLGTELEGFEQDPRGVTVRLKRDGKQTTLRCRYLVGSDGGRSAVRGALGVEFGGITDKSKWLVVDIRNDPLGVPNIYMHCDPARPYVSVALPDAVRRFEFMIFEGETEEEITRPERMAELMRKVLPAGVDAESLDYIRKRVYTHNARIADRWKVGRVLLAGDAAHIMPVWQGQGYNTGMRDATNLAWKLAWVVNGRADDRLLDTYQDERPPHAKAMIDLSVTAGRIFSPRNPLVAGLRDVAVRVLNWFPAARRYFLEMRYKPMPRYERGLVVPETEPRPASPVGRMFIQPRVTLRDGSSLLLDDALGKGFALLSWGVDPARWLDARSRDILATLDARLVTVKPMPQLQREVDISAEALVVGDEQGRLKEWFGSHPGAVVVLRPDRFVAAICHPVRINETLAAVARAAGLRTGEGFAAGAQARGEARPAAVAAPELAGAAR
ncbi:bifunctional 3-(3-hydroxy-phenyl)propionate/3-hydroxycinnamic acid hydroxylase [Derxia gummosa]|uniref:Bifunctional 3-(3-hydroxy-phenyl)propionate/3-hydroxycinnamic acid hydroxylase n=1 Tax=Derxia gummosa DSM 723 TaxID=1121388 RepID=A0A8B6XBD2_9BURK|nr:bifunctional 3-(3-hydroxy-phenyl)propionate/3-hydroxycinnamic acid hydroxylase [Derxia gummosa]